VKLASGERGYFLVSKAMASLWKRGVEVYPGLELDEADFQGWGHDVDDVNDMFLEFKVGSLNNLIIGKKTENRSLHAARVLMAMRLWRVSIQGSGSGDGWGWFAGAQSAVEGLEATDANAGLRVVIRP